MGGPHMSLPKKSKGQCTDLGPNNGYAFEQAVPPAPDRRFSARNGKRRRRMIMTFDRTAGGHRFD
jgi:hypothetical protein